MKQIFSQNISSKITISILIILASLTSCEEFLDQKPTDGLVYEEYWKNKEEVLSTLGGAYQLMAELDYSFWLHGELRGDMLKNIVGRTPAPETAIMTANIEVNNWHARWDKYYSTINICNHIIKLVPSVDDPTFSPYLKQQMISEATFIRSLLYFYMVRIWKDIPYITEPTINDESEFFPVKISGEEVLRNIKADLIEIRNKMPEHPTYEKNKSRATAGAVNALLADICLWNFEYEECITYIDSVENSGDYFLLPAGEWFQNYNPGFSLENIFEIFYDQSIGQPNLIASKTFSAVATSVQYYASDYAEEILSDDVTAAGEITRGPGSISINHQVWKYAGSTNDKISLRPGNTSSSANFIVYRLADLYLMKAEAYSQKEAPDFFLALEYLNKIRARVNMPLYSQFSTAKDFEDAILLERAKELAFEGKRWFDLLRMGRRNNYARKDDLVDKLIQNVSPTQKLVMKSRLGDPNGWYMPIHILDIDRNKNLIQNTYYDENK